MRSSRLIFTYLLLFASVALVLVACHNKPLTAGPSSPPAPQGDTQVQSSPVGPPVILSGGAQLCPPGSYVVGINAQGLLLCDASPLVQVGEVNNNSNYEAIAQINLVEPSLVLATGSVLGVFQGYLFTNLAINAGVMAAIDYDGVLCNTDLSFEGESSSINFYSSTSCARILPAGSHQIRIRDLAHGWYPHFTRYEAKLQYTVFRAGHLAQ